ncbi:MAG TPA: hypothetical protein VJH95_05280, partial [Candidatus Nanoarchaeia archaeon]|nr:hypothetical protein [Candidatus Nanoarchaeia archaeon]
MISKIKRGYDKISREHVVIFLVFLTAIILFNSFGLGYTGLVVKERCESYNYGCCDAGYGEGIHYNYLDDSCLTGRECWNSCYGNKITGRDVFENLRLVSSFFGIFEGGVRGGTVSHEHENICGQPLISYLSGLRLGAKEEESDFLFIGERMFVDDAMSMVCITG